MDHILTGSFPVVSKSMTTKRGSKAITMVLKFTNLNQMTSKGCPDWGLGLWLLKSNQGSRKYY